MIKSTLTDRDESRPVISKIALVGGTHGNERTGIELLRRWKELPHLIQRPGLKVILHFANPAAAAANRRYIDRDLNRCFAPQTLLGEESGILEESRARQIDEELGPRGSERAPDLCVDIHNTSSNMGLAIIFNVLDPFMRKLLAHLAANEPLARLYYQPLDPATSPFLPSIGKRDLTIDAGPQHHGTLSADLFIRVERMVQEILDFTAAWNHPDFPAPPQREVELFTECGSIDYPRDPDGKIVAMIHPGIEGMDFQELPANAPLFLTFDGKIIWNSREESLWPVFVNEQAYYEKGVAMSLTRRTVVEW